MRSDWTRAERLAMFSVTIAIAGILVAFFLPELRSSFNLESDTSTRLMSRPNDEAWVASHGSHRGTETRTLSVSAKQMWTDTHFEIQIGDHISIQASGLANASGVVSDGAYRWVGPDGWGYTPEFTQGNTGKPTNWIYVLGSGSSLGCMTGKIGEGKPFMVGSLSTFVARENGALYLGFNDHVSDWDGKPIFSLAEKGEVWPDNDGSFIATVRRQR